MEADRQKYEHCRTHSQVAWSSTPLYLINYFDLLISFFLPSTASLKFYNQIQFRFLILVCVSVVVVVVA